MSDKKVIDYNRSWGNVQRSEWPKTHGDIFITVDARAPYGEPKYLVHAWKPVGRDAMGPVSPVKSLGKFWEKGDATVFANAKLVLS